MNLSDLKKYGIEDVHAYDFLNTNNHLGQNIHLLTLGGSRAYGTNTPSSDVDIRGIATNSPDNILLGRDFETVVNENTDTTIYSVEKIFSLLTNCNPNTVELLFVRPKDIIYADDIGKEILDNRELFLSNKCIQTFGGYANAQLYRLRQKTKDAYNEEEYNEHIAKVIQGMKTHLYQTYKCDILDISSENGQLTAHLKAADIPVETLSNVVNEVNNVLREYHKRSVRNDKATAHGKICKHAMHLVRLYQMGTELMETGTVCTYREKDHNLLMDIRNGKYLTEDGQMNSDFFDLVKEEENRFNYAKMHSVLPDVPNYEKIDELHKWISMEIVRPYIEEKMMQEDYTR